MQWSLWKFIASVMFGMRQTSNLEGWTCPVARFKLFEKVIGLPSTSPQGSPAEIWGVDKFIRSYHKGQPPGNGPSKTKTPGWYWQLGDLSGRMPRKYVGLVWSVGVFVLDMFWRSCFMKCMKQVQYLYWPTLQLSLYMSTWSFEADN